MAEAPSSAAEATAAATEPEAEVAADGAAVAEHETPASDSAKKVPRASSASAAIRLDDSSDDEEDEADYRRGGYHPVTLGEVYKQRYRILKKLGWGHFSTVWLVKDTSTSEFSALKIVKSASHYTEAAEDEVKLLREIRTADPRAKYRHRHIQLLDDFRVFGVHGTHIAMVTEVLGCHVLKLIKHYQYRGLPRVLTKRIIKQTLEGLDYLHTKCSIIHTDIKPENILMCLSPQEVVALGRLAEATYPLKLAEQGVSVKMSRSQKKRNRRRKAKAQDEPELPPSVQELASDPALRSLSEKLSDPAFLHSVRFKIADLGNACWVDQHFASVIQTRQYRSLEVILGDHYDTSADVWSVACMAFELSTGDFLFDPHTGKSYDRNEDHIALIMELLGPIPSHIVNTSPAARHYFDRRGRLKRIKKLREWLLVDVLCEKYNFLRQEAELFSSFLTPMLHYNRIARATAAKCLKHPWLAVNAPAHLALSGVERLSLSSSSGATAADATGAESAESAKSPETAATEKQQDAQAQQDGQEPVVAMADGADTAEIVAPPAGFEAS
eukprot:m.38617 g.38617  ORF g.38617 m.38617 type:complete len:555 (-) comp10210_c0_seq2:398-2062(-)